MSDYTGSSFISAPVEDELIGLQTLINENKDANGATQALLDQEIYDREQADITLQNQINGAATSGALTAEITARIDGDTELGVRITNNSDAIGTATTVLGQEIYDRGVADTALQNQINDRALQSALMAEASTRLQDDEALGVRITDNTTLIGTTRTELAQEITNRETADTGLQNQINGTATQVSLNNEIATRTADDLALGVRITDNTTLIGTTRTDLTQETSDRIAADTGLQNQINDRALTLSLNNEITARTGADTALGERIDFEKTTTAYYIQGLQTQINTNQTAITAEESARQTADTTLQASITANATAITTKADDTSVVKLTGTQTIVGEKTFTSDTFMSNDLVLNTDEARIVLGSSFDRKIYRTDDGIRTDDTMDASQYKVSGTQIASNNLSDGDTLVKLLDGTVAIDGDVNLTAGKAYKIDDVTIPTHADLALKANLDGGNTFTGEQDINGYAKIDRVMVQAVSNDYPPFRVTNSYSSFTSAQIDADKNALLVRSNTTLAGDSIISAYNNSKNDVVFKVGGDGKLTTKEVEADGDINLTAGKAYKIDNVPIPTHADLDLKAPIENASLTGNTQMTRLTVNHSDSSTIGLDFNNTNVNQYAGAFNTAGYGWRFFNDNTSQVNNNTFGVFTKGTGSQLNPLLVKNDGKLYTLDQEVDGDVNLSTGHVFKINGVPLSSGGMTPAQEAELTDTTSKVNAIYDTTAVSLNNVTFANSHFDPSFNNTIDHIEDMMAVGQVPQDRINSLIADLASKRDLTNNTFSQLNLNGTTQNMTSTGGTINATDYFTEFDLTGLINTDLVVGIQETDIEYQTKCIFIKTEDSSNQIGNLIIRSNYLLTDQDIILRKKGDCVFLHADWDSSRWKVLGVFSSVQQTLTTTGNIVSETDILCKRHLFSNSAESTYIDGFTTINLRTPTGGTVPSINIDGQEAFMTKGTNQTITGEKTFENGIITDEVVTEASHNLLLKTADTSDNVILDNGSTVGLTQTSLKTSLNRALNIPYASVPLGTSTANKSPPTNSLSGDVYRDNSNALFIVP